MALIIAGERSGVGKTTVTLALLSWLSQRGKQVQSFKVGPDYIDPMFHRAVTGRPCRNLDPVITSEAYIPSCFTKHCQEVDYALVEGVMGLFDGTTKTSLLQPEILPLKDFASTAHVARLLNLPVLLVIDCRSLSGSVAAIAHGYRSLDPRVQIAGVVLNRVGSERHREMLQDALETLNLPILGILPRQEQIEIPDRHLGLVPTAEIEQLDDLFKHLAQLANQCFDWQKLLPLLATSVSAIAPSTLSVPEPIQVKIAVASDRAFNFYYQDNLDFLEHLGAQLVFWSPLEDPHLPQGIQGMYFGGGFPEVFASDLAANVSIRHSVAQAIAAGIPTYAECGGLMYLCEAIIDFTGEAWPMVGVLPTTAIMEKKLTLGYRQAQAIKDSPFLSSGKIVWGHEFHRSRLTFSSNNPLFVTRTYKNIIANSSEGWYKNQLHASYIHLHFGGYPNIAKNFLACCQNFNLR